MTDKNASAEEMRGAAGRILADPAYSAVAKPLAAVFFEGADRWVCEVSDHQNCPECGTPGCDEATLWHDGDNLRAGCERRVGDLPGRHGERCTCFDRLLAAARSITSSATDSGLPVAELNRLHAADRAGRRLRAALRDLVTDVRALDERLLQQRDNTPDHKKALGIERAASHVRGIAASLERILGVDSSDLAAYLNQGSSDLRDEAASAGVGGGK